MANDEKPVVTSPAPVAKPSAPAVHTENPFKVRRKALEAQLLQQQADRSRNAENGRTITKKMLEELNAIESRTGSSGANVRTPRGNLLQVDEATYAKYPDDHFRWVNEKQEGRVELLQSLGYERVPDHKRGGDLVLYKIPREKWAAGEVAKQEETERNLRKATSQSRDDMVHEFQQFLDKEGVNLDADKMISREV